MYPFKYWDTHSAKTAWSVNTRGSAYQIGLVQSKFLWTVERNKILVVHIKNMLEEAVYIIPASGKGKPICGMVLLVKHWGAALWTIQDNGEVQGMPQVDLILVRIADELS